MSVREPIVIDAGNIADVYMLRHLLVEPDPKQPGIVVLAPEHELKITDCRFYEPRL